MAAHGKLRRERGLQAEYETQIKEMRGQLGEQLRCLELQGELRRELLQELAEFMRRRAEVELEYSRGLEKLAERFSSRGGRLGGSSREHQSFRKEPSLLSPLHCWAVLLQHTRQQSRESAALSEALAGPSAQRLSHIAEDVGRLVRKSKDLVQQLQEELLEVVSELQTAKKTYHAYHVESVNAEAKLREAERQEEKRAGRSAPAAPAAPAAAATEAGPLRRSSVKKGGRLVEKRHAKFLEHKLQCTKARNEYLLSLASVNAAVSNYYLCDILDLMDVAEIQVELELRDELLPRAQNIQNRLDRQAVETEEVNKTLKATLQALLEVVASDDGDTLDSFQASPSTESLKSTSSDPGARQLGRRRGQQQETESFYIAKLQEYLSGRSVLAKLQAKHEKLQEAIQRGAKEQAMSRTQYTQRKFQKSRQPRPSSQYNHRLFGGDMQKFIQSSGQPVPLVVESCIRFINLNGLQHEGIFRVSGAQPRVSEIRDAFERGEDPLVEGCTMHDLDSVAGVLKLYFRSLEPPLFPLDLFHELLASAELEAVAERVESVSHLLAKLPASVLVVLRYLFSFLNHLAQYSDENMMDPYNLAVCFGPTLLPVPAGQDPVALQGRLNQLVQTLIVQPSKVFPPATVLPGPVYEKCMAPPSASCLGDVQLEGLAGENEPEEGEGLAGTPPSVPAPGASLAPPSDPGAVTEAVACFAYTGRTAHELTFQRGDVLRLHTRASPDWWRGELGGVRGLIPHKYITLPAGPEPGTPPETVGPSGRRRHCLLPTSPERPVEVDKAVAQHMESVFQELLGKTAAATLSGPGARSPKPVACSRLGRSKGFSRGPGAATASSESHPQGPDSIFKPH
uniref:Rho GTPase activating protein 4 n=1 Tax=Oryctolagus cuniculus TaxID=9986 RepID=A0A5F9C4J8_RABIT